MSDESLVEFNEASFDSDVLKSDAVVMVYFRAPWCGPCRGQAPIMEELATDFAGKALIGKVNTDMYPSIPTAWCVTAIPTVLIFKGGKVVDKMVGINPKDRLANVLNKHLA